ncbi:MAG: mechanosensitive ion channel [Proteobacteria bacterium]|nr:mechanosensitive ion channel [Pseudomonadota bacterium]
MNLVPVSTIIHETWARVTIIALLVLCGLGLRLTLVAIALRSKSLQAVLPNWLSLQKKFAGSLDLMLIAGLTSAALPMLEFSEADEKVINHVITVILTIAVTWFLVQLADFTEKIIQNRLATSNADDLRQRRIQTQIQFLFRLAAILLLTVGLAATLMSFDGARRIGASLIASAGVASVVVGFAAQKSLANLIAGFQIAFTQPIRIGDVVVVESEWGIIEEISLTYVVVKIWDLRRLILPITYFVEKPFQNWTRTSATMLGYIYLYTDYRVPVEKLRERLKELVELSPLWDRHTCILQVTNITEKSVELRALVSARSASEAFDLRCELREKMLDYISSSFPEILPMQRAQMSVSPVQVN